MGNMHKGIHKCINLHSGRQAYTLYKHTSTLLKKEKTSRLNNCVGQTGNLYHTSLSSNLKMLVPIGIFSHNSAHIKEHLKSFSAFGSTVHHASFLSSILKLMLFLRQFFLVSIMHTVPHRRSALPYQTTTSYAFMEYIQRSSLTQCYCVFFCFELPIPEETSYN